MIPFHQRHEVRRFAIPVVSALFVYLLDAVADTYPFTIYAWLSHIFQPTIADLSFRLLLIAGIVLAVWLASGLPPGASSPMPTYDSGWERRLLDATPDAITVGDALWNIVDCNPSACALYGLSRSSLLGRRVWSLMADPPRVGSQPRWDRLTNLEPVEGEVLISRSDGSQVLVWRKAVPLKSASGDFSGFVFVDREFSHHKQELDALKLSHEHLSHFVENASEIIFRLELDGRIVSLNRSFETLTGHKRSDWFNKMMGALIVPDDVPAFSQRLKSLRTGHSEAIFTTRLQTRKGDPRVVEMSLVPQVRDGHLIGVFGVARDITDRMLSEEQIRTQHQELVTLHRISELIATSDSLDVACDRVLEEISQATGFPLVVVELYDPVRRITSLRAARGVPLDQSEDYTEIPADDTVSGAVARTGKTVVDTHADDSLKFKNPILHRARIKTFVCVALQTEGSVLGVLSLGHPRSLEVTESRIRWTETLARYLASLIARKQAEDLLRQKSASLQHANEELEKSKAILQELAIRDDLTGVYNRREMHRVLREEVARASRYRHPANLAVIDLDLFKQINDTYGHQAGDEALRLLAQLIQNHIRISDRLFRYGGDEFAVIIPEVSLQEARAMLERVRRLVEETPFRIPNATGEPLVARVTLSLGLANYPEHARTDEDLLSSADSALYEAKMSGRNRIVIARPVPP
ncbi:MAG: diguanylate cyclase [bacterium JZ-2024 1]